MITKKLIEKECLKILLSFGIEETEAMRLVELATDDFCDEIFAIWTQEDLDVFKEGYAKGMMSFFNKTKQ